MANDWIKMRVDLWDHPKVVRIASELLRTKCGQVSATNRTSVRNLSEDCPETFDLNGAKERVIAKLFRTWSLADCHTEEGNLAGYDEQTLDFHIGLDGWCKLLALVGWLEITPESLIIPRFTEHNGTSAKRRAEDSKRKRTSRDSVRKVSDICPQSFGQNSDQRREEKRREEDLIHTHISETEVSKTQKQENPSAVDQILATVSQQSNWTPECSELLRNWLTVRERTHLLKPDPIAITQSIHKFAGVTTAQIVESLSKAIEGQWKTLHLSPLESPRNASGKKSDQRDARLPKNAREGAWIDEEKWEKYSKYLYSYKEYGKVKDEIDGFLTTKEARAERLGLSNLRPGVGLSSGNNPDEKKINGNHIEGKV